MRLAHRLETALLHSVSGALGALPWQRAIGVGAQLGRTLHRAGLRVRVARENLAIAFPALGDGERERILALHYAELGRVAAEYPHLARLVRAPRDQVFASFEGERHLHEAAARGRGVILLTGHFGNFELFGASLGRIHPVDFVFRPPSNPGAGRWLLSIREAAGVGQLTTSGGIKRVFQALRQGRWVALLGDQDARSEGVFVPFLGRAASTPAGPARIALATGAPIVFGSVSRAPDGRHRARIEAPIVPEGDPRDDEAIRALTLRHTRLLERAVLEHPEAWFWLHRRWKTKEQGGAR